MKIVRNKHLLTTEEIRMLNQVITQRRTLLIKQYDKSGNHKTYETLTKWNRILEKINTV